MPRRLATGRPGSAAIPSIWAAGHRPAVETTLTGRIVIRRPNHGDDVWDGIQVTAIDLPPIYDGPCRAQAMSEGITVDTATAGDLVGKAAYLIVVPADVEAVAGDLVDAIDVDPALNGTALRISRVVTGTHRFERDLYCVFVS